jgi:DNA-binding NarL/FixJ family response regulator
MPVSQYRLKQVELPRAADGLAPIGYFQLVVALTSYADEDRVHAALEAGASGYLLMDADADEVAKAVRAAHRGELQLDPAVARRLMTTLRAARNDPTAELTSREVEVLRLIGAGKTNKEIATELVISERTARTHVSHILGKLGLSSRTQAALWAVREGLADRPPEGSTEPHRRGWR